VQARAHRALMVSPEVVYEDFAGIGV
jgi:hypothetical protein